MERTLKKGPTVRYGILQFGYYVDYLIIASFAAVFFAGRGFTTGQIGIVTAGSALLSCLLQHFSGSLADKSMMPLKYMVMLFMLTCCVAFVGLWLVPHAVLPTMMFYLVAYSIQSSMAPLLNSLCLQFSNNGYSLNFGMARACGSLGYALAAFVMGYITDWFGGEIIIPIYIGVYAVLLAILSAFPIPVKDTDAEVVAGEELLKDEKPSTTKEFFSKYHRFLTLMAGFVMLWFGSNIISTYMIYFVQDLGGNSTHLGLALFVMAMSEIPAVMFGTNIMGRIGAPAMLRVSACGGIIRALLTYLAPNITFFVWLNVCNILLSGFYQVSAVYYVYSIVGEKDIIKGQSLMGIATTGICAMSANYLGGIMMESIPHHMILLICVLVNVCAFAVIWIATDRKRFANETIRNI